MTSSGTLVTLVGGLVTLSTRGRAELETPVAGTLVIVALGLFIAAAISGLLVNLPKSSWQMSALLRKRVEAVGDEATVLRDVTLLRTDLMLTTERLRARALTFALALDVIAIACLGVAAGILLSIPPA